MRFIFLLLFLTTVCSKASDYIITDIIEKAKKYNPELQEIQQKLRKYTFQEEIVSSLPDTQLTIGIKDIQLFYRPFDRNIEPMQSMYLSLSQKIPSLKKLRLKKIIVKKDFYIEKEKLKLKEQKILKDLYTSLYKIWLYREKLKIINKYKKVIKGVVKLSNISYEVGKASQSDVINAQIYYTKLKEKEIRIKSLLKQEEEKAQALIGVKTEIPEFSLKDEKLIKIKNLEKKLKESPVLKVLISEIEKQKDKVKLANTNLYPDFKFFVTYSYRKTFRDYISAGVSLNLPVFNKKKYLSEIFYEKTVEKVLYKRYSSKKIKIKSVIKENIYIYKEREEIYNILKTVLLQSKKSFETVLSEFKVGKKSMIDVLFSLKQLITIKEEILENRFNKNVSAVYIKSLLGELK